MRALSCAMLLVGLMPGIQAVFADDDGMDALIEREVISVDELEATRGLGGTGDFLQLNDMELDANMTDNVIHSSSSGNNAISSGAFSETSGFATVIQNSGNHVIIQNATIINFKMGE